MIFYKFASQQERREFGGSAFIEIQFCKLPSNTKTKALVATRNINNWQNDSLYINDENAFYDEYSPIFTFGVYGNLKTGVVDIFGVNYYAPDTIEPIINKLLLVKPLEYQVLVGWLIKAKAYNGFYILGM